MTTRPVARIEPILDIIREAWLNNPDMRLGQLLSNADINFYDEDLTDFVSKMHINYLTTPVLWGTRGKSGKAKIKYVPLDKL